MALSSLLLSASLAANPSSNPRIGPKYHNPPVKISSPKSSASFDKETGLCDGPIITITDQQLLQVYQEDGKYTIIECAIITGSNGSADFSGKTLDGIAMYGVNANSANFDNANLRGSKLYGSFNDASFISTNLQESILVGSYVSADFSNANLEGDQWPTNLNEANLSSANLTGIKINNYTLLPEAKEMQGATYDPSIFNPIKEQD
jgi:hypothetical protein